MCDLFGAEVEEDMNYDDYSQLYTLHLNSLVHLSSEQNCKNHPHVIYYQICGTATIWY